MAQAVRLGVDKSGKDKKPDITISETQIGIGLSDEDALKQAIELRRKGNYLFATKKGIAEDVFKCYDESLFRLKFIVEDEKKAKGEEYIFAIPELAQTLLDKSMVLGEIGAVRGDTDTYSGLLDQALKCLDILKTPEHTGETLSLQADCYLRQANYRMELGEIAGAEKNLVFAAEKLLLVLKKEPFNEVAHQQLEIVSESLHNGKKERQRNGKAVYHMGAEFLTERGITGSWKTRFFCSGR